MTRWVLEKLCTKKVCVDFLAPMFFLGCSVSSRKTKFTKDLPQEIQTIKVQGKEGQGRGGERGWHKQKKRGRAKPHEETPNFSPNLHPNLAPKNALNNAKYPAKQFPSPLTSIHVGVRVR